MARFYGIRAKETGQNLNECTRIVNELPRMNRSIPRIHLDLPVYCVHVPGSSALNLDRLGACGRARARSSSSSLDIFYLVLFFFVFSSAHSEVVPKRRRRSRCVGAVGCSSLASGGSCGMRCRRSSHLTSGEASTLPATTRGATRSTVICQKRLKRLLAETALVDTARDHGPVSWR